MAKIEIILIGLEDPAGSGTPETIRLRKLLKIALRIFGLKALRVREIKEKA